MCRRRPALLGALGAVGAALVGCSSPAAAPAPEDQPVTASLLRTTDLGRARPPSTDTSGITYLPRTKELLIVDSEVEEEGLFRGVNMWTLTRGGAVRSTGSTLRYTREPSGVAYDPRNRCLYIADDDNDRIFEVREGADGRLGTSDDVLSQVDVRVFGDSDTEDVAVDTRTGELLLVDAERGRINKLSPGPNGRFDGVPPRGDDTTSSFDIHRYGATDVEGLTYDAARRMIFMVSHRTHYVYGFDTSGRLLTQIDISEAFDTKASGLVLAPASSGSGTSLYIVDRGVDNSADPRESDGRLFELRVDLPPV
jgi:DNA-binding beta-propeller fold protein YncE